MIRVSRSFAARLARSKGDVVPFGKRQRSSVVKAESREAVDFVQLDLPMPPSKNRLWQWSRHGVCRTPEYKAWRHAASKLILLVERAGSIIGPYALRILVCEADTDCDLGNLEVATSDVLQHTGVIQNDRLARSIISTWDEDGQLASGIRVFVASATLGSGRGAAGEGDRLRLSPFIRVRRGQRCRALRAQQT